ncbi:MAG: Rab family GTPase [Candidatus Helarchaeota archaeon]
MIKDQYKFKIAVIGEPNIGKSTLNKLCTRHFDIKTEKMHEKLYGVSFAVEVIKGVDIEITLIVWNFTGQNKYRSIQKWHLEGVSGVLLLFDLTNKESFEKLPNWLEVIGINIPNVPIILVGTKADKFQEKKVDDSEIEDFFNKFRLQGYSEVSFITGLNFEPTIKMLADAVFAFRTLDKKTFRELKINRHGNYPLILDESKTIETIASTIDEIINIISNEVNKEVNLIKSQVNSSNKSEINIEIEKIKNNIEKYDQKLEKLNNQIPISSSIFYNQLIEWKKIKDNMLNSLNRLID